MNWLTLNSIGFEYMEHSENTMHAILVISGILFSLLLPFVLFCLHESLYVSLRRSR